MTVPLLLPLVCTYIFACCVLRAYRLRHPRDAVLTEDIDQTQLIRVIAQCLDEAGFA